MRVTPNMITLARIALIPVFVTALLTREPHAHGALSVLNHAHATVAAFILFAVTAGTDGLDGYLARSRKSVTTLGIFLDPLADKLLITAALVTLVELREIAAWIVIVIISREFAVTGLRLIASTSGDIVSASWLGKAKTTSQIALVLALIPRDSPELLGTVLTALTVGLTVWSGVDYFWKGREHLREVSQAG